MSRNIAKPLYLLPCRKYVLVCFCMFFSLCVKAQVTITVRLHPVPAGHAGDSIFIAGNFNGWNPGQQPFSLVNDTLVTELKNLDAGLYEFKFTRGTWGKVECTAGGGNISNHSVRADKDTALVFAVSGWIDDFPAGAKTHTVSSNVRILDTAFIMPELKRQRRIWIYLPEGYAKNKKHYPVIYMQDGQNVFDNYTSGFGEWGVDEILDSLIENGKPASIVVGIDHGGPLRMSEYNPYPFTMKDSLSSTSFTAEGDAYLDFIVNTLKPYIDKHYRTIKAKESTAIAGSSMGGLISYYAALKYPNVFGGAGIFSPAFWTAEGIDEFTDSAAGKLQGKYFFYMGGKEGKRYVDDMIRIREKVGKNSSALVYSVIDPDAQHNEQAWRKWFAEFYNWIMADGYNVITGGD